MSTSIDDLFPEGVPEPQPAPSETTDTPENWVLHTADNPLYPPLNAIPDAVRQVRNISVEMSDIVEQHAAMIQDLYSTRLAPPEDGELTTGVPPSDSALSSLSKSVEKLLRKQAIILHDLKTFQLRQEAFERGMMRSKLELERKIEYQDRKLAFLDKELNQRHLKAAHEIIMAHTNTASHSADIEALWQAITKVDVKGAAKADKRRSTVCHHLYSDNRYLGRAVNA